MTTTDNEDLNKNDLDFEDEDTDDEDKGDKGSDNKNRKPESDEDRLSRLKRQTQRLEKKLGKDKSGSDSSKGDNDDSDKGGLDKSDRAFLRAEKITHPDEISLVKRIMEETGKDIEQVLDGKYFKTELKDLRDERIAEEASPRNSKRQSGASTKEVDYWLAKGQMPPADQPELRREYVNKKYDAEKNKSQFSSNPVV